MYIHMYMHMYMYLPTEKRRDRAAPPNWVLSCENCFSETSLKS